MKSMANNPEKIKELKNAGISDNDIEDMMECGLVPDGWQVHHKIPLDQGGTNDLENLVLIKNHAYHKVITNEQNSLTKGMKPGESKIVDFPIPEGGFPQESNFKISDDEGESLVNKFYGIGDMKSNLCKVFEVLEGEIPEDFISIGNDPGGNEILLGVSGGYQGKVYFWIHDIEPEDEMDNMFILADSFTGFFNNLYESE